jgi:hypothetical protein
MQPLIDCKSSAVVRLFSSFNRQKVGGVYVRHRRVLVAVTGAQGVGKTQFCERLVDRLSEIEIAVTHLKGLGDAVRDKGIPVGSDATTDSVAAVYTSHLERERTAVGDVILLERCGIDALAYVRSLAVNTPLEIELYEEISRNLGDTLDLAIHLRLEGIFADKGKPHESPELRARVAEMIPSILAEFRISTLSLCATETDAIDRSVEAICKAIAQEG